MNEELDGAPGSAVRVLSEGAGAPLLYIHGSGDAGSWLPAQSELAQRYSVIRPDLPGYNGSDYRHDISTVANMAAWLWTFVDERGMGELRLVGSSLGGWIAAQMAVSRPAQVSHLVLLDPVGISPEGGSPVNQFAMSPSEILDAIYHSAGLREKMGSAASRRMKDPVVAATMAGNAAMTRTLGEHPYFHDPALADSLHLVTAKTLIIWGENDGLVPVEVGQRYERAIVDARLHVLPACGHLPLVERTREALDLIIPFIAS